jgi:hypothetical protein
MREHGLTPFRSLVLGAVLLSLLPVAAHSQAAARLDAGRSDLAALARATPIGRLLHLQNLELDGGEVAETIDLERFRVFAPDARIVVDEAAQTPVPQTAFFRGFVDGEADSPAVLAFRAAGPARGLVLRGNRLWLLQAEPGGPLRSREVQAERDLAHLIREFECGADALPQVSGARPSDAAAVQLASAVQTSTASYTARVAIETDYEYFALFGDVSAAVDYIGDLFAFASTIYQNEIATDLLVEYVSLWTEGPELDPWSVTSGTSTALSEYRTYWAANRDDVPRSIGHMLSGKRLGGGIAYIGTLCDSDFGYGLSASLNANFDLSNPSSVWDIYVVTHEIGHTFNSPHTHDYCGIGGSNAPVDGCVPDVYGSACDNSSSQLPAGCPGPGQGCGSIMSYCHLIEGSYGNIAMSFGLGHAYGVEPDRVPARMYEHVVANASCLGLTSGGLELTVDVQGTGGGRVTSDPPALDCSDW